MSDNKPIRDIVVLGGGSAGWLTAGLLAAQRGVATQPDARDGDRGIRVTVIESPAIPIIGVGEGTWPSMRTTLRTIGLSETALFRDCDAAFKQGAKFCGWMDGSGDDCYYHPLVLPHGFHETDVVSPWLADTQASGGNGASFADWLCCQARLCDEGRAPKQITTPEYAAVANYAYHLDAVKLGQVLRRHCTENLGVTYIPATVTEARVTADGDIAALATRERGEVPGDLFVDCSGLRSLLLGGHYGIGFECQREILFNDTAIAAQLPYPTPESPIASQTNATAHRAGWIWDIGLPTRRGVGLVYASGYMEEAEAEQTLRDYAARSIGRERSEGLQTRRIDIQPGHRKTFWTRNCVAIGLSAGFLEPLEASALVLVESAAAMLSEDLPAERELLPSAAERFNTRMHYYWQTIVDFLKLHYVLSRREDTPYWIDHRKTRSASERLNNSLARWRTQIPNRYDFPLSQEMFPAASWHYVLYGMGFRTDLAGKYPRPETRARAAALAEENRQLTARYLSALPPNRELIDKIRAYGLPKV